MTSITRTSAITGQALMVVLLLASAATAQAAQAVANGGFEQNGGTDSNVFTGWTVEDQAGGSGSFFVQTGTTAPSLNPITVPPPPQGAFAAMTAQGDAGSHLLYQTVTIPSGSAQFSAQIYFNNDGGEYTPPGTLDYTVAPNQQVRIDIMTTASVTTDVGAGVLKNIYQTKVGDPLVSGYTTITSDLSGFAGQTVRLRIAEVDTQGFFQFGIDQVSVDAPLTVPTLSEYALVALGLGVLGVGLMMLRRHRVSA